MATRIARDEDTDTSSVIYAADVAKQLATGRLNGFKVSALLDVVYVALADVLGLETGVPVVVLMDLLLLHIKQAYEVVGNEPHLDQLTAALKVVLEWFLQARVIQYETAESKGMPLRIMRGEMFELYVRASQEPAGEAGA